MASSASASSSGAPPGAAAAPPVDLQAFVRQTLAEMRAVWALDTAPDGPFPMAEEEVPHFGTKQRYKCYQRGPNSLVRFTLPELYGDIFVRFIDQELLVYEGERLTYGATIAAAAALARSLRASYGVTRGTCVAIAGRNHPDWVVSLLAITGFLSAVALPVNSWWVGEELRYGLQDSKTVLLVADQFILERAPFLGELGVAAICMRAGAGPVPGGYTRFEEVLAAGRQLPGMQLQPVDQEDGALLMYTSGTTNKPKGVVLTQRGVMTALNTMRLMDYRRDMSGPQAVILIGSPLFHVNGSHVGLFAAIVSGAKVVTMYKWDPKKALELVQAERVVRLVGVPTMTYEIMNHPDFDKYDTSSLVGVGGGGSAFAAPMIKRVSDKFTKARAGTGYGLTETNAVTCIMPAPFFPARPTSCGFSTVNVEVCILGEKAEKLQPGDLGEICIRGASIMKEYWGKPDKTAEAFHIDAEGRLWFRSGDLGTVDEDGFVYIMDRAKDIIIRGGENISCGEVEAALFEHPSVAEVAAIGVPHENLGEVVAAAVIFKVGAQVPSMEELRQHAASRLAAFKVPSEIFVWEGESLPRGATGKIQKRDIRDHIASRRRLNGGVALQSKL